MADQDASGSRGAAPSAENAERAFRRAMAQTPAGVAVTAVDDGLAAHAMTVSSFTSVSLAPPLCLICVKADSPFLPILRHARRFAVHTLTEDQEDVAQLFASRPVEERLRSLSRADAAPPRLANYLVRLTLSLWREHPAGDHSIVVGEVERIETALGDAAVLGDRAFDRLPPALTWWRSALGSLTPR